MGTFLAVLMPLMLFMGYPFMIILIGAVLLGTMLFIPGFDLTTLVQQTLTGMKPFSLVCIPMFILAANLITAGEAAQRLIRVIKAYIGHITGGLPVTLNAGCTLFGAVSGSTQATLAAIGAPMRPMLLEAGYSDSWTIATTIAATDMAILIPPSIGFIVYGVATATSVGKLYLAGIGPGILLFLAYSIYCVIYSRIKKIPVLPRVSWAERWKATKEGVWLLGFPIIVIGGIYSGIFSPTEAAAASVVYALFIELVIYRSLTMRKILDALLSTGVVTAVVFLTSWRRAGILLHPELLADSPAFRPPVDGRQPVSPESDRHRQLGVSRSLHVRRPRCGDFRSEPHFPPLCIESRDRSGVHGRVRDLAGGHRLQYSPIRR